MRSLWILALILAWNQTSGGQRRPGKPGGTPGVRSPQAIEAEKQARELFSAGDYERAIPILEDSAETSPDDLGVLSLLGTAYLYSATNTEFAGNIAKAKATMEKVIDQGGEAVLLVARGEDPRNSLLSHMVRASQGELRIREGSLSFVPARGFGGAFGPVTGADIKECGPNRSYGRDSNTFHLKILKDTVNFRPLHFSKDEAILACSLAAKYLGVKTVN